MEDIRFFGRVEIRHRKLGAMNTLQSKTCPTFQEAADAARSRFRAWMRHHNFRVDQIIATVIVYRVRMEERYRARLDIGAK